METKANRSHATPPLDRIDEAIIDVLERHPQVRALFDNGWLLPAQLPASAKYRLAARPTLNTTAAASSTRERSRSTSISRTS